MLTVTGTVNLESEAEVARVRDILVRRAQRSRNDKGCLDYNFSVSVEDPTEVRVFEKWEDQDALDSHLKIQDDEFYEFLRTARISNAVVVISEISGEREMLRR